MNTKKGCHESRNRLPRLALMLGLGLALLQGCATSSVSLRSNPGEAEVFAGRMGDSRRTSLGKTPLNLKGVELEQKAGGPGPVFLEFRKDGYTPASTLVTSATSADLNISLELSPSTGLEEMDKLNEIVDLLFEGQRLAKIGRYPDALAKIKTVQEKAPKLAASYELEGGIYYLQKKYKEAYDAYSFSARYNPKNPEALRMKNILKETLSGKRGAP